MSTVLCLGEALIDVVAHPDGTTEEHVGGSPLNVAGGLARLEHPTTLACWIGHDERGQLIREWLTDHLVTLAPGSDGAERTATAQALLNETGQASYTFDLSWDLPEVDLDGIAHVHTGSLGAVLEPGADKVLEVLHRAGKAGISISYDPNIRPALMGCPDDVRERIEQIVQLSDVVKASDEDLAWLYPDRTPEEALLVWSQCGPSALVMTRGAEGAALVAHGEVLPALPRRVDVIDTVGAGDSFMAGLLSGLLDAGVIGTQTEERVDAASALAEAVARAISASAITVTHAGAFAPGRDEL